MAQPISIFIQVQPRNEITNPQPVPRRNRYPTIESLKEQFHTVSECIKYFCGYVARGANQAGIPILEDSGNQEYSMAKRIGAVLKFVGCIIAAFVLCWFLEKETTKNSMEEELVGIDISNGPLPAVEVRLENMFTTKFLENLERSLSPNNTDSTKNQSNIDIDEKIALAYLMGQQTAGKHKVFKTISEFLTSVNKSGHNYLPTSEPVNKNMKVAIGLVTTGTIACEDIIKNCEIIGVPTSCTPLFVKTLTPRGFGCSFNIIPVASIERIETIRSALSENVPIEDLQDWKEIDKDKVTFSNDKKYMGSIDVQRGPGEENGISFEVYSPQVVGLYQHFFLSVGNPRDHATTKTTESKFALGSIHHLNLEVTAEHCSPKIRQLPMQQRKCLFYEEGNSGNYDGYTFQRCFSSVGAKRRGCLLSSEISPPVNGSMYLCHPSKLTERYFQFEEQSYRAQGHTDCPKSCNDIHYGFTPKSELLFEGDPSNMSSFRTEVHIFYSKDEVLTRMKGLKGFTAEQIGIVLGVLGFCNEITLPTIVRLLWILFVYVAKTIWRKLRNAYTRRFRNAPVTLFLPVFG